MVMQRAMHLLSILRLYVFSFVLGVQYINTLVQSEAYRALSANNYELKKRRIAVTLADSRVGARHKCLSCFLPPSAH